jgi:hypothetical protein
MQPSIASTEGHGSAKYAITYFLICVAGIATGWIVAAFVLTSFFAFIYLVLNRGPRSWGSILLMLIPVVGALIALDRLLRRAWPQLLGGIFFYVFPLFLVSLTGTSRVFMAAIGGGLLFAFLSLVPSVAHNPKQSIIFMWAIPSTMFFVIAAIVLPFVGHAANVDAGDHQHDFDPGHFDHDYHHNVDSQHQPFDHSTLHNADHNFDHGIQVSHTDHSMQFHQPDKINLNSYPQQSDHSIFATTDHFNTHSDHLSGHFSVTDGHGQLDFRYDPLTHTYHGLNSQAEGISLHHDLAANTMNLQNHDGLETFHFDKTTGDWIKLGTNGMTRIHTDANTGNISVTGLGSHSTIRIDPITGDGTGTTSNF